MRPVFAQLMATLVERELLIKPNGTAIGRRRRSARGRGLRVRGVSVARSSQPSRPFAGSLAHARQPAPNSAPILRGEKDAVQVLFAGGGRGVARSILWRRAFTSHWLAAIAGAVQEAARHLPEGRGLRILEIGAGTGGLAAQLLPLLERGLHSYIFSDVSAAFFPGAGRNWRPSRKWNTRSSTSRKPAREQEFEAGSFDFILGTNVRARRARRARRAAEPSRAARAGRQLCCSWMWPRRSSGPNAVFGLTSGWWRFTDRDLRPNHPLLQRAQWEAALREARLQRDRLAAGPARPARRRRPDRASRTQGSGASPKLRPTHDRTDPPG